MEPPANYVGYKFTAAPYAEHTITHMPVPDRKQVNAIKKGLVYEKVLKKNGWWDQVNDLPYLPFTMRGDGAISRGRVCRRCRRVRR